MLRNEVDISDRPSHGAFEIGEDDGDEPTAVASDEDVALNKMPANQAETH
jgi:hypothetical protein